MKDQWRLKRSSVFGEWKLERYLVLKDKWLEVDTIYAYNNDKALEYAREQIWWYEYPNEVIEIKDIKI